jgi:hypothetical protein
MITLRINGYPFKIYSKLSDFNLKQARKLFSLMKNTLNVQQLLYICSDIPPELIIKITPEDLNNIFKKLEFITDDEPLFVTIPPIIKVKDKFFILLNFEELTTREVDKLEFYLLNYSNEYDMLHLFLDSLLKRINKYPKNILNINKEVILYDEDNSEFLNEYLNAETAFALFYSYLKWREQIHHEHTEIWTFVQPKIYSDEEKSKMTADQLDAILRESNKKDPFEKWGFYPKVMEFSSSLQDQEMWWNKNFREFLKYWTYYNINLKQANGNIN